MYIFWEGGGGGREGLSRWGLERNVTSLPQLALHYIHNRQYMYKDYLPALKTGH